MQDRSLALLPTVPYLPHSCKDDVLRSLSLLGSKIGTGDVSLLPHLLSHEALSHGPQPCTAHGEI
jgi:hypothetical protein